MKTLNWNTLRIYITLYHTWFLLYCKWHNQMTSSHSIINMETKSNLVNKWKHWIEIHLEFLLHYITLTDYYIVMTQSDDK